MALFETKRALFFDDKGEFHGRKGFSKNNKHFKYGEGSYNVDFKNSSYYEDSPIPLLWKRRTYYYPLSSSNPFYFNNKLNPPISPELYNINLETKVARDLNDLAKGGLSKYLTPRNIIIGLIIIVVIWYISSGKKIF